MRGRALALALVLATSAVAPRTHAQDAPEDAAPKKTPAQQSAERHYKRARELYQLGRYREAIAQLEAALRLDPKGAELLYNLGLVHEKLGDADEAIDAYKRYLDVLGPDADPEEVAKIKGIIRRLEGAKSELKAREAKRMEHRFTALSGGLLVGAGVSLLATIVIGAQAIGHDRQARDFVVRDESGLGQRQVIVDRAKSEATLANVFGVIAVVSAGVGLGLYFTSEYPRKDDPNEGTPPPPASALRFTPLVGLGRDGGNVFHGGTVQLEVAF